MPNITSVMQRMYRLISFRPRSEKEVRDYFRGKEQYSTEVIETAINRLKNLRLMDDEQFAKAWVESRSRKLGVKALKQELIQKGITRDIIEKVMEVGEDEEEVAQKLLEKKSRIWSNLPILEFKKKAFGFLGRKGFEYGTISRAVEKLTGKS